MTLHEQDIVNSMPISDLLTNINARVFSMQEEIRRLKTQQVIWHDLRENPNDLPRDCENVLNQDGYEVAYSSKRGFLGTRGVGVIAWCEIPLFKKE